MSGPWFKFYPADWRADPALRMCSVAARGLWMEMLCLMHEAHPRGSLLINGNPVSDRQLASLAGTSAREIAPLLVELEEAGVFSREDNRTIFSRRMRRDDEKAARDKANGKSGGNPRLKRGVNPPDNLDVNGLDKAQKPEARNQRPEDNSPAQHLDPPSQGCAAPSLEMRLREAAGLIGSEAPSLRNTAPIAVLIEDGFDLEAVILPTLRSKAGKAASSWAYFVEAIREAKPAPPPKLTAVVTSDVFVAADSDEGRAWEAHWREFPDQRKVWIQGRTGYGRAMPSRWPPSDPRNTKAA